MHIAPLMDRSSLDDLELGKEERQVLSSHANLCVEARGLTCSNLLHGRVKLVAVLHPFELGVL